MAPPFGGKALLARAVIDFRGESSAAVRLEVEDQENRPREGILAALFFYYYPKILFNLGRGETADSLIGCVNTASATITEIQKGSTDDEERKAKLREIDILGADLRLVQGEAVEPTKSYVGELHEKGDRWLMETQMSAGGETYYAPSSVMALYQQLVSESLPPIWVTLLVHGISAINYYLTEGPGDYANLGSLAVTPSVGMSAVQRLLEGARRR